jgi:hypothetical protein
MLRCTVLGHRHRFVADGTTLRWHCERCGAPLGARHYDDAASAQRYARALEGEAGARLGGRALPFGLLPLRLLQRLRRSERG